MPRYHAAARSIITGSLASTIIYDESKAQMLSLPKLHPEGSLGACMTQCALLQKAGIQAYGVSHWVKVIRSVWPVGRVVVGRKEGADNQAVSRNKVASYCEVSLGSPGDSSGGHRQTAHGFLHSKAAHAVFRMS